MLGGGRTPCPRQHPELQPAACREEAERRPTGSGVRRRRRSAAAVPPGPHLSHRSGLRGWAQPICGVPGRHLLCRALPPSRCCWRRLGSPAQLRRAPHRRGSERRHWRPLNVSETAREGRPGCAGRSGSRSCCGAAAGNSCEMLWGGAAHGERGTRSRALFLGRRIKVLYFDEGFLFSSVVFCKGLLYRGWCKNFLKR